MIYSLVDGGRQQNILQALENTKDIPGDMAELGVYQGGSAYIIATHQPNKKLHLFDTFEGIPENDEFEGGVHVKGEFASSYDEVKASLAQLNVVYHKGFFPDTTQELPPDIIFSFVHLDADIYQSTLAGIEYFWHRLTEGGVIIFDDYNNPNTPGVNAVVDQWFQNNPTLKISHYQAQVTKCYFP